MKSAFFLMQIGFQFSQEVWPVGSGLLVPRKPPHGFKGPLWSPRDFQHKSRPGL
jgi:hypothetical protein